MDTIKEIVNLLLMQGNFGKPGAGACPVRGHSNVQGDRTFGIWEKPKEDFLQALDAEFGIVSPREEGHDSTHTMYAMAEGNVDVFVSLGGNLAMANSDTAIMEDGLKNTGLTVHISTKPNRSHVTHGKTSIILPTLGRSDRDDKHPGGRQFLSVENSMSVVSSTQGSSSPSRTTCCPSRRSLRGWPRPSSRMTPTMRSTGRPWQTTTTSSVTTPRV